MSRFIFAHQKKIDPSLVQEQGFVLSLDDNEKEQLIASFKEQMQVYQFTDFEVRYEVIPAQIIMKLHTKKEK